MRTLILGIPLPHVTFDNYSFLSAPSLFDYDRMVVEMAALSDAVEQVVAGSQKHQTFGGQTVVNGPSAPRAFSLAELLRLRRLEVERLLARGGIELADDGCPFTPYVEEFGARLAFRAYVWEQEEDLSQNTRVFARSPGGAAVGVELTVGPGQIVLLPPIGGLDYDRDRAPLANVIHRCLERLQGKEKEQPPHWIRKEAS